MTLSMENRGSKATWKCCRKGPAGKRFTRGACPSELLLYCRHVCPTPSQAFTHGLLRGRGKGASHDSIYKKGPAQANPWRWQADGQSPGAGRTGRTVNGYGVSFRHDENALNLSVMLAAQLCACATNQPIVHLMGEPYGREIISQ